jgi:DNA-binding transcriptional LysR family regulator
VELRHLRYFTAVAEELHFTRAAARLRIAQPPLSQQIRALETELDAKLFFRTKRRVDLTPAGRLLLEHSRQILSLADRAAHSVGRASRGEVGHLVVALSPPADLLLIPSVLPVFCHRFPDVDLALYSMTEPQQLPAIRDGQVGVGILRLPIEDPHLVVEPVLRERLVVVLPEGHPLTARRRIPLRALAGEPHIFFRRHLSPRYYDLIVSLCHQAGFSLRIVHEVDVIQTTLALVAAGMGVAIQVASVQSLGRVGVVYRPLSGPIPDVELGVVYRRDDRSDTLQRFLTVVREMSRQHFKYTPRRALR